MMKYFQKKLERNRRKKKHIIIFINFLLKITLKSKIKAIIKMLIKAKKNSPPNIQRRLELVSGGKNGKVTKEEFMKFCKELELTTEDTAALCRICKFSENNPYLMISEFIPIIESR